YIVRVVEGDQRDLALLALSLLHDDTAERERTIDAQQIAEGQAYLNGFVVQMLAEAMHLSVPEALDYIRRLLGGRGDGAGDREPRRPNPTLPALAAERDLPGTQ